MIRNDASVIANSLWTATANLAPECPTLRGEAETDVAIIGGGFTGLSAALHLAEAGVSATVLEAETIGWGASGRNGGQVNPGLKEDPDSVEARFGPVMGKRMVRLSGGAAQLVFDLIQRHGIECDAVQSGWIQAAHDARAMGLFERRVQQWQDRGAPMRALSRDEIAQLTGTTGYVGGLIDARGGNLHPLNYALGLADAAQKAGAVLHEGSRAVRLERQGGAHVVDTDRGRLRAAKVLLCTNGYTDGLVPPLRRTVVPVRSVQVATEPLPDDVLASVLPGRQAVSDSQRLLLYYKRDGAGRLIMGGRGAYDDAGTTRQLQALREVTQRLFPQIGDVAWQHAWGGFVALTHDHYPHLARMAPGIMAGLGYNGRGVAMGTAMGKVLAAWAQGLPEADLEFPVTPPRPIPFHALRKPGVVAAVAWYRLLDRLGL